MPKLTIDQRPTVVPAGTTVMAAARAGEFRNEPFMFRGTTENYENLCNRKF